MAPDLYRTSRAASLACGALVGAVGVTALLGWVTGNLRLQAIMSAGIVIKTNTAVGLISAAASLLLLRPEHRPIWRSILGWSLALLISALGIATLIQHVFAVDLGIDQLIYTEPYGSPGTASPNRMGPPASITFPLLGAALLLLDVRSARGRVPSQWLALAAMIVAFVPLLGYVFQVRQLYGLSRLTGIALPTAVSFVLLALGILLSRPDRGGVRRLLADDSGGFLLRRLLPAAIVFPVLLGWLRVVGQNAGVYDVEFGRSLLVLSFIIVFSALTWWTGTAIQRHATAQARAEAAEREMRARLMATLESERAARSLAERSNRMKDEFLATLSHELRTPLNAILGWVQLLVRGDLKDGDARRGLEAIERNSRLQAQLIEDLLDMSRIEQGKIRLDVQEVDLSQVVDVALAAAAPAAAAKGLTLDRRIDPSVGPVIGDPARLQQVLWNLVSNAIKFTPGGGTVTVSLERVPGYIELSVRDTGIGISPEFVDHMFDRFRQADGSTTRRYGGLGLGLSIARQLTELHGGSLMAQSDGEGLGAVFTIRLPATAVPSLLPSPKLPLDGDESRAIQEAPVGQRRAGV